MIWYYKEYLLKRKKKLSIAKHAKCKKKNVTKTISCSASIQLTKPFLPTPQTDNLDKLTVSICNPEVHGKIAIYFVDTWKEHEKNSSVCLSIPLDPRVLTPEVIKKTPI